MELSKQRGQTDPFFAPYFEVTHTNLANGLTNVRVKKSVVIRLVDQKLHTNLARARISCLRFKVVPSSAMNFRLNGGLE